MVRAFQSLVDRDACAGCDQSGSKNQEPAAASLQGTAATPGRTLIAGACASWFLRGSIGIQQHAEGLAFLDHLGLIVHGNCERPAARGDQKLLVIEASHLADGWSIRLRPYGCG